MKELTDNGILPASHDLDKAGSDLSDELMEYAMHPFLMGKVAAVVNEKKSAHAIVDEMVSGAVSRMSLGTQMMGRQSKL